MVYSSCGGDSYLIHNKESPVAGVRENAILPESLLPLKYVAFNHCYPDETAKAAVGRWESILPDELYQFNKVEMYVLCRPEESDSYLEELIRIEEDLSSSLGLHCKTLDVATEDMGLPAYRKFDVKAWMPGSRRYCEISSASDCIDFHSRKLGIRYRPSELSSTTDPTKLVHTLNATACAVPAMIICLLENYQQEDGSVIIPEPLRPFMGGLDRIAPKSS